MRTSQSLKQLISKVKPRLDRSSQEIKNKIPGWISEGSGWTINSIDNHYLNIIKYFPLTGLSYIKLPSELRIFGKGLINL